LASFLALMAASQDAANRTAAALHSVRCRTTWSCSRSSGARRTPGVQ